MAQRRRRAQVRPVSEHIRDMRPDSSPHFIAEVLHVWERDRQLPFTDSMIFEEMWAQDEHAEVDGGQ